ncbi:hypothetical protein ZTR_11045 [Talaromyces verruculosus]|nr:hypothetical protein ZTR_11045 [Talaromyces verruculosus]
MDVFLDICDTFFFDRLYATILPRTDLPNNDTLYDTGIEAYNHHVQLYYPLPASQWATSSSWKRDDLSRQAVSLFLITWLFGVLIYLLGSTLLYHTIYNKSLLQHPKYLPHQIRQEIAQSMLAMPVMALLTVPFFLAEIHGWTKLYDFPDTTTTILDFHPPFNIPWGIWTYLQYPLFIFFTDTGIYFIHRFEHHPSIYRFIHKRHHKWIIPTPFASYAFNPLDGWAQSLPYHVFPLLFPLQKCAYIGLFVGVTMWTVFIRYGGADDAEYMSNSRVINGAACHTMHHLYFNYNYGQFTTFWDRVGGTYQFPHGRAFMSHDDGDEDQALKKID